VQRSANRVTTLMMPRAALCHDAQRGADPRQISTVGLRLRVQE
jgi:hypothetical protein